MNVAVIHLDNNEITSLDKNLFGNNLNLERITLTENKIEFVNSNMFDYLSSPRLDIDLSRNLCVDKRYYASTLNSLR